MSEKQPITFQEMFGRKPDLREGRVSAFFHKLRTIFHQKDSPDDVELEIQAFVERVRKASGR